MTAVLEARPQIRTSSSLPKGHLYVPPQDLVIARDCLSLFTDRLFACVAVAGDFPGYGVSFMSHNSADRVKSHAKRLKEATNRFRNELGYLFIFRAGDLRVMGETDWPWTDYEENVKRLTNKLEKLFPKAKPCYLPFRTSSGLNDEVSAGGVAILDPKQRKVYTGTYEHSY